MLERNIGEGINESLSICTSTAPDGTLDIAGASFDRYSTGLEHSCVIAGAISLGGTAKTTQTKFTLQDSADNSTWADYTDPFTNAVAKTAAIVDTATAAGYGRLAVNLSNARRYIRLLCHQADFTVTASSTGQLTGLIIRGGGTNYPVGVNPAQ